MDVVKNERLVFNFLKKTSLYVGDSKWQLGEDSHGALPSLRNPGGEAHGGGDSGEGGGQEMHFLKKNDGGMEVVIQAGQVTAVVCVEG
jgi:hypothetical protein